MGVLEVGVLFAALIFWLVVIMPFSLIEYVYIYLKTKGTMIPKPEYTRQERSLLR